MSAIIIKGRYWQMNVHFKTNENRALNPSFCVVDFSFIRWLFYSGIKKKKYSNTKTPFCSVLQGLMARLHWRFLLGFQARFCGDFNSPVVYLEIATKNHQCKRALRISLEFRHIQGWLKKVIFILSNTKNFVTEVSRNFSETNMEWHTC